MYVLALQDPVLRSLATHAVELLRDQCTVVPPLTPPARLPAAVRHACLLIHDFRPVPSQSMAWLAETNVACPSLGVFALLGSPMGPVLSLLMRAARFKIAGAAVADEERPRTLAARLSDANKAGELSGLAGLMAETWALPDDLARVVERLVADPRGHHTVAALLSDAGVGRKTFARQARRAGFVPPLRFLQATRVLAATLVVRHGSTTESAAEYLGYSSAETMRRHFLCIYGAPPRAARAAGVQAVAEQIRERLRGKIGSSLDPRLDGQLSLPL